MVQRVIDALSAMANAIRALESELSAERERREKARVALDHDGEHDAIDNLEGALTNLKRMAADPICIQTIERVICQLADAYEALGFDAPAPAPKDESAQKETESE
jgi:predicted  nucleic acid-binding Zn-ribbon protein